MVADVGILMDIAATDDLWVRALQHIQENEPEVLDWARSVSPATFRNLRLKRFLSEYCFVIYASGFKYATVKSKFPDIAAAFKGFDPAPLSRMRSLVPVLKVFGNERKAECFLEGAKAVIAEGFTPFKNRLRRDGVAVLEELPGLGPITKNHLAKNIGLADVAKADVWLERAAVQCGGTVSELIDGLSERHGETKHVIDVAIWMLGRDGLLAEAGKPQSKKAALNGS